jgi:hypothetical protein
MFAFVNKLFDTNPGTRQGARGASSRQAHLRLESLEDRAVPAILGDPVGTPYVFLGQPGSQEQVQRIGTSHTANERFVQQLYHDLLHRDVGPAGSEDYQGFQAWVAYLDSHSYQLVKTPGQSGGIELVADSSTDLVMQFESSPEYLSQVVQEVYQHYLNRPADSTGLDDAVRFLSHGGTMEQVIAGLAGSDEYLRDRAGSDSTHLLDALFADIPGLSSATRSRAEQERAGGASRSQVIADVLGTDDYRTQVVGGFYQRFLKRSADAVGLHNFTSALGQGITDQQVLAMILGEPGFHEYFNLANP